MKTQEPLHRGFAISRCPMCGTSDAKISVALDDVRVFKCDNDCEFGEEDVRQQLREWSAILDWLHTAPLIEEK